MRSRKLTTFEFIYVCTFLTSAFYPTSSSRSYSDRKQSCPISMRGKYRQKIDLEVIKFCILLPQYGAKKKRHIKRSLPSKMSYPFRKERRKNALNSNYLSDSVWGPHLAYGIEVTHSQFVGFFNIFLLVIPLVDSSEIFKSGIAAELSAVFL